MPQETRDSKIITLYNNKGDRNDCNNYRGISLLGIVGKVSARVILIRLQKLAECIYPESQCGFRAERATIDMVFSLRQLQEKRREQQVPLYRYATEMASLRFPKPQIESFHTDTKGTVQFNGSSSDPFEIHSGVKQGCVLSPKLFGIFFGLLLKHMPSTQQQNESTFVPDQMAGSSTSPVSALRQRYARFKSGTRCLLMTQQLRPTPRRNSSHSHRHVRTSV